MAVRDYLLPETAAAYGFTGVLDMPLEEFVSLYRSVRGDPAFYAKWATMQDRNAATAVSAWQNLGDLIGLPIDAGGYAMPGPGWIPRLELERAAAEPAYVVPVTTPVPVVTLPWEQPAPASPSYWAGPGGDAVRRPPYDVIGFPVYPWEQLPLPVPISPTSTPATDLGGTKTPVVVLPWEEFIPPVPIAPPFAIPTENPFTLIESAMMPSRRWTVTIDDAGTGTETRAFPVRVVVDGRGRIVYTEDELALALDNGGHIDDSNWNAGGLDQVQTLVPPPPQPAAAGNMLPWLGIGLGLLLFRKRRAS